MTNKERILRMVERWPDDISFEQALYHMHVLQKIDAGLKDAAAGRVVNHDELFDELERLCDEEEKQASMVGGSGKRPGSTAKANRGGRRAKNGSIVRKPS